MHFLAVFVSCNDIAIRYNNLAGETVEIFMHGKRWFTKAAVIESRFDEWFKMRYHISNSNNTAVHFITSLYSPRLRSVVLNRISLMLSKICHRNLYSSSSGSVPDLDLRYHDASFLSTLSCYNHLHSFYRHQVAQPLCKCQSLFSSVSSSFNHFWLDCIFNFHISHNIFEE